MTNPAASSTPPIVTIGGSAGSIEALSEMLGLLPPNLPAAVLITLHRNVHTESHLLGILQRHAHMPVVIPKEGEQLRSGTCYIGYPDSHLAVGPGLTVRFIRDGFYRAHNIDALFTSAARHGGKHVIGVILSGMRADGTQGLIAIKEVGGAALVQDPEEALWDEMPINAIGKDGHVDFVGTSKEIAGEICRLVSGQFASETIQSQDEKRDIAKSPVERV